MYQETVFKINFSSKNLKKNIKHFINGGYVLAAFPCTFCILASLILTMT